MHTDKPNINYLTTPMIWTQSHAKNLQ